MSISTADRNPLDLYEGIFQEYAEKASERLARKRRETQLLPSLQRQLLTNQENSVITPWTRIKKVVMALEALDRCGWKRSHHQKMFHDQFLRASVRIMWKTEERGLFQRDHRQILETYGWESLPQEILISTPRRFGKTISVSMFCAAMIYAAPAVEVSIYSTCKRISQKLLQNVAKFLELIYSELKVPRHSVIRQNMEEIVLRGPEGIQDVRKCNSYPSKVGKSALHSSHFQGSANTQASAQYASLLDRGGIQRRCVQSPTCLRTHS